jgi:hypothetical protein
MLVVVAAVPYVRPSLSLDDCMYKQVSTKATGRQVANRVLFVTCNNRNCHLSLDLPAAS